MGGRVSSPPILSLLLPPFSLKKATHHCGVLAASSQTHARIIPFRVSGALPLPSAFRSTPGPEMKKGFFGGAPKPKQSPAPTSSASAPDAGSGQAPAALAVASGDPLPANSCSLSAAHAFPPVYAAQRQGHFTRLQSHGGGRKKRLPHPDAIRAQVTGLG